MTSFIEMQPDHANYVQLHFYDGKRRLSLKQYWVNAAPSPQYFHQHNTHYQVFSTLELTFISIASAVFFFSSNLCCHGFSTDFPWYFFPCQLLE
jgi:hypothetical protein